MDYCIKCSQPLFHGTIPHRCIADIPCPSCGALRARIEDVDGMAMLLCVMMAVPYYKGDHQAYWARVPIGVQNYWREKARAVSAWLKEGKG